MTRDWRLTAALMAIIGVPCLAFAAYIGYESASASRAGRERREQIQRELQRLKQERQADTSRRNQKAAEDKELRPLAESTPLEQLGKLDDNERPEAAGQTQSGGTSSNRSLSPRPTEQEQIVTARTPAFTGAPPPLQTSFEEKCEDMGVYPGWTSTSAGRGLYEARRQAWSLLTDELQECMRRIPR